MDPSYARGIFKYDVGDVLEDENATGTVQSRLYDVDEEKKMYVVDWDLPFGNDWSIVKEEELDDLSFSEEEAE